MILVFDGNPFIYKGQNFSPNNTCAGAEYLLSSLIEAVRASHPDKVVVLFDPPTRYWRHAVYPDYKGHRKQKDRVRLNVREQINQMISVCKHLPVSVLCCPGYEADDAAYWVLNLVDTIDQEQYPDDPELWTHVNFVTIDRDWLQLVSAFSSVYLFDINEKITEKNFSKFECPSKPRGYDLKKFLDYKIILGDTSDNIKGIPGFGPVRCKQLIDSGNWKEYRLLSKDIHLRNSLLMDLRNIPFLPFAHQLYESQWKSKGELNLRALKPLLVGDMWSYAGELNVFKEL